MSSRNTRDYKKFAPETYYHVYNRGNGKQDIFLDEQDKIVFLSRLRENLFPEQAKESFKKNQRREGFVEPRRIFLPKNSFDLVVYCLMPNHYHFLIKQNSEVSLSTLMLKVCTSYSKYFNKKYQHSGHLFQDKFKAIPVETNEYILWLSVYIHQNPKVAGLVKNLEKYIWTSYLEYINPKEGDLCKKDIILSQFENAKEYKDFLQDSFDLLAMRKEELKLLLLDTGD